MRRSVLILLAVLLASGSFTAAENAHQSYRVEDDPSFQGYMPNSIVLQLEESIIPTLNRESFKTDNALRDISELDAVAQRFGVSRVIKKFPGITYDVSNSPQRQALTRFFKVFVEGANLDDVIAAYERLPMVTQAHKIPIHSIDVTPNDPLYSDQYGYSGTYGVDADDAWETETGDATVVVAILDTGVKYNHGDLGGSDPPGPADNVTNGNVWVNDIDLPGNGDEDNNGYVDDVVGWDFVESTLGCTDADCSGADNDPMDAQGHGTHVSGTASAINNNGYRVSGVAGGYSDGTQTSTANGVKILPCRIGWAKGTKGMVSMDFAAEAMVYVGELKARGVNVAAINCSWGSSDRGGLSAAVDYLVSEDVLVVTSAGNSNDSIPSYLGSRSDCLSVGSTDINGNPSSFSDFGSWVDVAAPGSSILSTWTGDGDITKSISGTSMSAPHVVGVAALLESCNPDLTSQDKWDIMCDPLNVKAYNETKYVGVGIVSADLSLAAGCQVCTDPPVADFSGVPLSGDLPLQVSFTDLSTNNPTAWDWDFGDGSPHAYTKNPVHTYNTANVYTVTLTATNDCGYDVEQKPNYIEVTESEDPPIAAFEGSPTSGSIPLEVTFTDLSTQGPTSWTWDFGDGSPVSYDRNPVHTYTVADIYSVTLTVSNAFGSDDTTEVDYIDAYEGGGTMHVHDMSVTERWVGQNCRGQGTVWVYDDNNEEVEFATVYATATGPFTESVSGITGPDGSVLLETSWDRRCTEEWCFEVTNITHSEYTYEPGDNVVTKECESGPVFRSSDQISEAIPTQYGLSQNYPNPFNPSTEIVFSLPEQGHVKLEVFNISGQKIATLADQFYSAGVHSVTWKADVSSGIYLYRIQANDYTENKKMILLK